MRASPLRDQNNKKDAARLSGFIVGGFGIINASQLIPSATLLLDAGLTRVHKLRILSRVQERALHTARSARPVVEVQQPPMCTETGQIDRVACARVDVSILYGRHAKQFCENFVIQVRRKPQSLAADSCHAQYVLRLHSST
jgi:hypothetical protein